MTACRDCGNPVERRTDPVGYGRAWAEVDAWGDDRDFQCGLSDDRRHHPARRAGPRYGDQTACTTCGMDVQWCGKPHQRTLIPAGDGRPAVTMPDGGWVGRGGDRFCDQSGAVGPFPHRLHRGAR